MLGLGWFELMLLHKHIQKDSSTGYYNLRGSDQVYQFTVVC